MGTLATISALDYSFTITILVPDPDDMVLIEGSIILAPPGAADFTVPHSLQSYYTKRIRGHLFWRLALPITGLLGQLD